LQEETAQLKGLARKRQPVETTSRKPTSFDVAEDDVVVRIGCLIFE
jgi:hypothetical protein